MDPDGDNPSIRAFIDLSVYGKDLSTLLVDEGRSHYPARQYGGVRDHPLRPEQRPNFLQS